MIGSGLVDALSQASQRAVGELAHVVSVRIGGTLIENWTNYSISIDLLQPADSFSLAVGNAGKEAYDLCRPDAEVQIILDGNTVLTGYIDKRTRTVSRDSGRTLAISGRDKGGRLVDESAPLVSFGGLGIKQLAEKMVSPWFSEVILTNASNRRLLRGGSKVPLARVSSEPAIDQSPKPERSVSPGQSRWAVLSHFLEEAELLGWSTADGRSFVVGLPNYNQERQYRFLLPRPQSARANEGNVLDVEEGDGVAERFSRITVVGMSRGRSADARHIAARGSVKNGPGAAGEGLDFVRAKDLIIADDDVRDDKHALSKARREMALRDSAGKTLSITAPGHSQEYLPGRWVVYAPDTMCSYEDEEIGAVGYYYITAVSFTRSRGQATTQLTLAEKGATLRL